MKKLNNIPQKGFIYNVINKLINTINELIEQIGEGVVPQWLLDLIEKKADKDGVYETLTAGNLLGRSTDATISNGSYIIRSSGGNVSFKNGESKLLSVNGNIKVITNGDNIQLFPFTATKFKSTGFNHFNPIEENILRNHKITEDGNIVESTEAGDTILLVRCINSTEANGYEITHTEDLDTNIVRVAYSAYKPTVESENLDIISETENGNSTSYLTNAIGWLAIQIHDNVSSDIDATKYCVHLCWSGYNDGLYEEYTEPSVVNIPYDLVHEWGLAKAGSIYDILDYEHKTWTAKVNRLIPTLEKTIIPKTPIVTIDNSGRTYRFIDNVGNNIRIQDLDSELVKTASLVSTFENTDTWQYTENETVYSVTTDRTTYYENKPCQGVFILKSEEITDSKVSGQITYNSKLLEDLNYSEHLSLYIDTDKKFTIKSLFNNNLTDYGEYKINEIKTRLSAEYLYYELNEYITGELDENNIYQANDFGLEYFDEYIDLIHEKYLIEAGNTTTEYIPFLLDEIRSLISRNLQDSTKIINVFEFTTSPTKAEIDALLIDGKTKDNSLFHKSIVSGQTYSEEWYKYNGETLVLSSDYKMQSDFAYIWQDSVSGYLVLNIDNVTKESLSKYFIQFKISDNTLVNLKGNIFTETKWTSQPILKKGSIYQLEIINGITNFISVAKGADTPTVIGNVTTIHINESSDVTDPADKVTCEEGNFGKDSTPEENVFAWIKANTHAYVGTWNENNPFQGPVMELKQLDDSDFNNYADGTSAWEDITGGSDTETLKHDVFIKLPKFYYISEAEQNGWKIKVSDTPQEGWIEWDDTKLIGAYEALCSDTGNNGNGILRSISGVTSTANVSQVNFKTKSRNRNTGLTLPTGKGFQLITFDAHSIIGIIFYGYYGTLNSQAVCGSGTGVNNKFTGTRDNMGMTDTDSTNGNTGSIRFMGLDNWWGNKCEWVDNLVTAGGGAVNILKFDGTVDRQINGAGSGACINKMNLGRNCDLMPKETSSGSDYTVNYADYGGVSTGSGYVAGRSSLYSYADGGVGCLDLNYGSGFTGADIGSRLLFCGPIVLVS